MSMHHEWLSLIEISGPFLAIPVLKEVFPQGLEELDAAKRKRLRQAYDEWHEAQETDDPRFADLHTAWIDEVLSRGLELDEDGRGDVLKGKDWCATHSNVSLPEHGVSLSPDFAVVGNDDKPLMLVHAYGPDVDLDATSKLDGWASTPAERMVTLCRATGCRLGLVTNGERWMLVDAPVGAVTTFASWYARIWGQEPVTLQAFVHLLSIRRFFVDESERLPALFDRSLKFQDEVTDALGEQVRRAVEVLIQALDKADQDRSRELLRGVKEAELYEAALTVMMRLVFLLSAEERGLLLLGDERYEANYALSTLRMQLRAESDEILERRWDAWSRLLAVFRAVYGGIEHENLRLPALGGSLFDPDRFPFLEGRAKGSDWRIDVAKPLPIDNRTVLLLLDAIQQFQGRTLSYRALDVEQIGYVYEGLLERTVKRTAEVTLELDATKSAQSPWVTLAELESARLEGSERLAELLQERSGSSASRVRNDLNRAVDDALADRVLTACHGDTALRDRIKPFGHLVRTDPWGYPLVYPAGAFIVTTGSDRRETGTHYTPKSLTEAIVAETLTPVAYVGPAEGTPREQWALKSPAELLDLKICDPAMGSGAFLVQACRWLSDRLVEAWSQVEATGKTVSVDGDVLDAGAAKEPLPRDSEARTVIARRLIAERCLYGVDLNPLAVELAKLSIWLVTLAKGRPFGFLDHNLRCGDSLLGIHRLDQLTELSMTPTGKGQQRLFGQNIERAVHEAIELRQRLRQMPIRDIRDVEAMARLDADARQKLEVPEHIADALVGEVVASGGNVTALGMALASLAIKAGQVIDGDLDVLASLRRRSIATLSTELPTEKPVRKPFHWPLEFPEVFQRDFQGFNSIVSNPPFMGGLKIRGAFGAGYRKWIDSQYPHGNGRADFCAYFLLRFLGLVGRRVGTFGMVATNTIYEGESRETGLGFAIQNGAVIYRATRELKWPGHASLTVSVLHVAQASSWLARPVLDGVSVDRISPSLTDDLEATTPYKLAANKGKSFQGANVHGMGFICENAEAERYLQNHNNSVCLYRFMIGDDLNNDPLQQPSRWVVDFRDRPLDECEAKWPDLIERIRLLVKPFRDTQNDKRAREKWWCHYRPAASLYAATSNMEQFLATCEVTKHLSFSFVRPGWVISSNVDVIALQGYEHFSVLQSSIHDAWARRWSSRLETRLKYSNGNAFETFPFPHDISCLMDIGVSYLSIRDELMRLNGEGLTKTYNRFHDPRENYSLTESLRLAHREIDRALADAYGWVDLDLGHDFHEVSYLPESDRVRFTISEPARIEALRRLWELNRQRYEEEVAAGLHGSTASRSTARAPRERRAASADAAQPTFNFDEDTPTTKRTADPAAAILSFLASRIGWHAKADVLAATGISDGQWNAAITDLVAGGKVERQGERRGARYRATDVVGAAH